MTWYILRKVSVFSSFWPKSQPLLVPPLVSVRISLYFPPHLFLSLYIPRSSLSLSPVFSHTHLLENKRMRLSAVHSKLLAWSLSALSLRGWNWVQYTISMVSIISPAPLYLYLFSISPRLRSISIFIFISISVPFFSSSYNLSPRTIYLYLYLCPFFLFFLILVFSWSPRTIYISPSLVFISAPLETECLHAATWHS